ncbi:fibronectin type III domain-containing protein [Streptomyces sp. ISL-98]|uniref:fibronectin type III domain-containing protein n=1 Tax=Streptomyces sp. ISL-98 TaxID=2819192 RepID=UPI001BE8B94B|nr:fibronectin type III domain-containing protein [Streptomyces sp. ISL-98]MBT2509874.1 fibronectin type III domain-containing protein [Streptomyces sp. ISL-98]
MKGPTVQRPTVCAVLTCSVSLLLLLTTTTACSDEPDRDSESPSTPDGVTAQAGSATSVHVMWDRASDNKAVTRYEVYQKGAKVKTVPGARHMTNIDSLTPSTAYRFTVRARDAAGNLSAPSSPVPVTTPAPTPDDRKAPSAPVELRGRADGGRAVSLTWGRAADDVGVTSYDIYQEDSRIHTVPGTATTARVSGLRPGTVYTFTVRARDAAENSSKDSNALDLTTASAPGDGPSTAPTALKATPRTEGGVRGIDLAWTPPRTGEEAVREYQLFLNGKLATTIVWGAAPPTGTATYRFTVSEPAGTRFSIKLRAKLPDGKWGDFSAQRTVVVGG